MLWHQCYRTYFCLLGGPLLAAALAVVVHRHLSDKARAYYKNISSDKHKIMQDNAALKGNVMLQKRHDIKNKLTTNSARSNGKKDDIRLRKSRRQATQTSET